MRQEYHSLGRGERSSDSMPSQTATAGTMKHRIATHAAKNMRGLRWRDFPGVSTASLVSIVRAARVLGGGQPYLAVPAADGAVA
jgi:hypothetical protein